MEQNRSRRQAPERSETEVSEAQIAVHWQEENYFSVPKDFTAQANLTDKGVFKRFALEKFPGYYKEFAELLDWRSEEHTSELQSRLHLVCRLLLEKKKKNHQHSH